jgi:hypothetical protein
LKKPKALKSEKNRRHRSDYYGDCGQDDHTWSSDACPHPGFNARKVEKRRKDEVATDTDAKRDARPVDPGPGIWNGRRCWQQRLKPTPDSALGMFHKRLLMVLTLSSTKAVQDQLEE